MFVFSKNYLIWQAGGVCPKWIIIQLEFVLYTVFKSFCQDYIEGLSGIATCFHCLGWDFKNKIENVIASA